MEPPAPRFEYRVWAPELEAVEARIRASAPCEQTRESAEVYIVSTATDATNLKVRRATLDMKVLLRAVDGLEQWTPRLRETFPVPGALLVETVFPALGVAVPALEDPSVDEDTLLAAAGTHPALRVVPVDKTRFAFTVNGCIAEIARVAIAGAAWTTAAVEATDADAVWDTVRRLGLDALPNCNYVRAVKRAAGLHG